MKRFFVFAVLIVLMLSVCGCQEQMAKLNENEVPAAGSAPAGPEASVSGSPAPVLVRVECEDYLDIGKMLSWMYEKRNGDVDIQFDAADSVSGAIDNIKAGDAQAALLGLSEDELSEYGDMKPSFLFSDGIAIIVNSGNGVENLSLEQLKGIFTGDITDWAEVGGAAGRITVYAGLSPYIQKRIDETLNITTGGNFSSDYTSYKGDYGCEAVKNEAGGISFASLSAALGNDGVKALSIEGVAPEADTIASGSYPLKRDFYIITADFEQAVKFAEYCQSDPDVAAYLYDKGYVRP